MFRQPFRAPAAAREFCAVGACQSCAPATAKFVMDITLVVFAVFPDRKPKWRRAIELMESPQIRPRDSGNQWALY